jgi:hypothetical protein
MGELASEQLIRMVSSDLRPLSPGDCAAKDSPSFLFNLEELKEQFNYARLLTNKTQNRHCWVLLLVLGAGPFTYLPPRG